MAARPRLPLPRPQPRRRGDLRPAADPAAQPGQRDLRRRVVEVRPGHPAGAIEPRARRRATSTTTATSTSSSSTWTTTPSVLRNDGGNARHWLIVAPAGHAQQPDGPRRASHGRPRGSLRMIREATTAGSIFSGSDSRVHFGLGDATTADLADPLAERKGADAPEGAVRSRRPRRRGTRERRTLAPCAGDAPRRTLETTRPRADAGRRRHEGAASHRARRPDERLAGPHAGPVTPR